MTIQHIANYHTVSDFQTPSPANDTGSHPDLQYNPTQLITGLILAGGRGSRTGGRDKGLIPWQGKPLVAHTVARVKPQVKTLLISCNRNPQEYAKLVADPVIDLREDYQGPLAGLEAAIDRVTTDYLLLAACDVPRFPLDLGRRLYRQLNSDAGGHYNACVPWDGEREQYLCALIRRSALASLGDFLDNGGRAVRLWYRSLNYTVADCSDCATSFQNINRPE